VFADEFVKVHVGAKKEEKVNVSGDKVLALDDLADKHIEDALASCPLIAGFASEEREDFVSLNKDGKYIVVFDPLDGSQNVPVTITVGAIYGVFEAKTLAQVKTGDEIVAAGYALFSSALQFAFTTKETPVAFSQYDFATSEWVVFIADHKCPKKGKTYAINEGSCANWDPVVATFVAQHLRGRSVRWMSCMVSDVHRQLLQGGAFMYPIDNKYPKGRLRLVYEAIPMAFIWERAGAGAALATTDGQRILDVPIGTDVHAKCGIMFLGEEEAALFTKVRTKLPLWKGGSLEDKIKAKTTEQTKAAYKEVSLLRVALVVGALFNVALLIKHAR